MWKENEIKEMESQFLHVAHFYEPFLIYLVKWTVIIQSYLKLNFQTTYIMIVGLWMIADEASIRMRQYAMTMFLSVFPARN